MKVIDLLNKIANGEEVPKFWWNGCIHQIEKDYNGNCSIFDTYCKKYKKIELNQLNDEVKIIEEDKKIEKIEKIKSLNNVGNCPNLVEFGDKQQLNNHILKDKINEIIDAINELKKGE